MGRPLVENLNLPSMGEVSSGVILRPRAERQRAAELVTRFDIRAADLSKPVTALSGGNQQKVLFAKWLAKTPRVLVADEPTRGIDVGAKRTIYELIKKLAASGMAVLLISSELEEVLGLAHRILVMRAGRIVSEFAGDVSEEAVMRAAFVVAGPAPAGAT
jgi:rhamnose transport system ATP-binding protein